ncbi:MAG: hypothetical protein JSV66_04455 [Trueperaceae bacterium]|nr:MAG: hypothetical protein JSV66_04455 [Trueperaceae bacterium]
MMYLAGVLSLIYAVVNAFGAWAVIRRKPLVASLFMLAASCLIVAAVALVYKLPFALWLLGSGLMMASIASLMNAWIVLGRVVWRFHLIRAVWAGIVFAIALFVFR